MKKLKFLLIGLISIVFIANSSFAYPVTCYDTDLRNPSSEELKILYDVGKFYEFEQSVNVDNNTVTSSETIDTGNANLIEKDYVEYEDNLYSKIDDNLDLSINVISDNYKYKIINKNVPDIDVKDYDGKCFLKFSELDNFGRCGLAIGVLGIEIMPKEGTIRESIGMIKPSGWQTPQQKYDFIDGKYLYNRCHLIAWQLSNENANEKNLITGTRWFNTMGMLPFENQVANYIRNTKNHVIYKVTPIFEGNNLLASRVQLEALSYEDNGEGLKFNVLIENYQPGVYINYATGESHRE